MKKMPLSAYVGIALATVAFLLLPTGQAVADISVALPPARPEWKEVYPFGLFKPVYQWTSEATVRLRLAKGESEGIMVLVKCDDRVVASIEGSGQETPRLEMFLAKEVFVEGGLVIPDALVPVTPENAHLCGERPLVFYIKATTTEESEPGRYLTKVSFTGKNGKVSTLAIESTVHAVTLPDRIPVTIQASVWPVKGRLPGLTLSDEEAEEYLRELLFLLSTYRINAVAGMGELSKEAYEKTARYALDTLSFVRLRLPVKKMYNWEKPLGRAFLGHRPTVDDLASDYSSELSRFDRLVSKYAPAGKLSFKIWDEPREKDYPDVTLTYRAVREASPLLRLELSEEPHAELSGEIDIWTPYIRYLKPDDVARERAAGKEVWVYANKVHGIDHPLHGMRILGWIMWKYNLDGYLFWAVNWWKEDPWNTISSQNKDFLKRGTLLYSDFKSRQIYPSLRLEAFRDGIEDLLLLKKLEEVSKGPSPVASEAETLLFKLKRVYDISERYDNAPDPAMFKEEILDILIRAGAGVNPFLS